MPVKLTMAGLRLAVLLLLVLMWLRPAVFYQQVSEIKPTIGLLRDSSLSIEQTDKYENEAECKRLASLTGLNEDAIATGQVKRTQLINTAFEKNPSVLKGLRDKGNVRVVDFATGSKQVAFIAGTDGEKQEKDDAPATNPNNANTIPDLAPKGLGTDFYQVIRESLEGNSRVSALVMVADGQDNGNEDPVAIARKAASLGVPIYVVGVGDPNPPRNLSVQNVYAVSYTHLTLPTKA